MKTLFILSLPRSLSTLVYHVARLSLELNEPGWTSDGEILNNDRYIHYGGKGYNESLKYIRKDREPEIFIRLNAFLDQVIVPQNFIYKDVVHPFVVSNWLKKNRIEVLKIKRKLADVAYSMLSKGWYYPAMATKRKEFGEDALIHGLIMAEKAIESVPGVIIDYDSFVLDDKIIIRALETLYPEENINSMGFIDDEFRRQCQQILERRKSDLYKKIEDKINREKNIYFLERENNHEKRNHADIPTSSTNLNRG